MPSMADPGKKQKNLIAEEFPDMCGACRGSCFGEFREVVADEGNQVGEVIAPTAQDCKNICYDDASCNSFAYCAEYGQACWLKDRVLNGSEATIPKGACKTYYKRPCWSQTPTPTPSPTLSPTPAPSTTLAPTPQPTPAPSDTTAHTCTQHNACAHTEPDTEPDTSTNADPT